MMIIVTIELLKVNRLVCYITPTFSLSKEFYNQLLTRLPKEIIASTNATDLSITLKTGSKITFVGADGKTLDNNLRGRKYHLCIVDEASIIDDLEYKYNEVIRPTLVDYSGSMYMVSTPKGFDFFNKLFVKGQSSNDEGFKSFHYSTFDNPFLPESEKQLIIENTVESALNQEYYAIPQSDGANPFGIDSINKQTIDELSSKNPVIYGIDLAKTTDYTVIIGLDEDNKMCYFQRFQKSWVETQQIILGLPSNITKVIDCTGVGSVIYEELINKQIQNLRPFLFTKKTKPQLIIKLIQDVQKGLIWFTKPVADEMKVSEYTYKSGDYVAYSARSGYHDDTWIALSLANFYKEKYQSNNKWKLYRF